MEMPRCYYQSTIKGITETEQKLEDLVYVGVVIRCPYEDFPFNMEPHELKNIEELFQDIKMDGYLYEYVAGGVMERYEIRERETGDMVAIWRIPYRLKTGQKTGQRLQ